MARKEKNMKLKEAKEIQIGDKITTKNGKTGEVTRITFLSRGVGVTKDTLFFIIDEYKEYHHSNIASFSRG